MEGVLRDGRPLRSKRVVVYVAPGAGESRAAVVAGRKVGRAVARNRARRILRETWNSVAPQVRDGHRLVLVARAGITGTKTDDLIEEVSELLQRADLTRPQGRP